MIEMSLLDAKTKEEKGDKNKQTRHKRSLKMVHRAGIVQFQV